MGNSPTVNEVLDVFTRHVIANGIHAPETAAYREHVFRLFREAYGTMAVADLKRFHLTDFIEAHPEWKASDTRGLVAGRIKAAFNFAFQQERISRHPFANIRYASGERREEMPDDVLREVIAVTNTSAGRVFRFLRLTGCRVGELCAANWGDVDMEKGIWSVPKHKTRKKTGKARRVALIPEAVELLQSLPSIGPGGVPIRLPDSPVFVNSHWRRWSRHNVHAALDNAKRRFGITARVCVHSIRHRFAGAAVAAGAPIALVGAQLGHSSVQTTERYYVDLSGQMDAIRDAAALTIPPRLTPPRPPGDTEAWKQLVARREAANDEQVDADRPTVVDAGLNGEPVKRPENRRGIGRPLGDAERIAWEAYQFALTECPGLGSDAEAYGWLVGRPEFAGQLPPTAASFRRYCHYARIHYTGMTKHQMRRAAFNPPPDFPTIIDPPTNGKGPLP